MQNNENLRMYIEELFEGATPTKRTVELKEEMLQNLTDKYRDLLAEGKTPEAAYNIAVAGIGDVSALLRQLEYDSFATPEDDRYEAAQRKSAMITAAAVMMYILSVLPPAILFGLNIINAEIIAIPIFLGMVAIATGLLVYNNMTKPKHHKKSDTMVEDFRAWRTDSRDNKQMRKAVSSALWSILLVIYFVVSFTTGAWHITWVIFILGGVLESLVNILFSIRR